jgi:3-oxoacyl-[acyl-carrier protein] reductase
MEGAVILITGTSKGIGQKLADYYLSRGFIVAGCSRSDASISHARYKHYKADLNDEKTLESLVRNVVTDFSRLDSLINNAGIASMNHIMTTPVQAVHNIFNTNFIVPFILTREAAKVMQRKKSGRIINFSTVAVPLNQQGEAAYASSKAALETLTRISSKELAPFGITVNAVGISPYDSALIRSVPYSKIEAMIDQQALKRKATISDIVNVTDFYISPDSSFITGQTIYLGGVF